MTWDRLLTSCKKRHDDFFKRQFQSDSDFKKLLYEKRYIEETMRVFESKIQMIDKKVKNAQVTQEVMPYKGQIPQDIQEK